MHNSYLTFNVWWCSWQHTMHVGRKIHWVQAEVVWWAIRILHAHVEAHACKMRVGGKCYRKHPPPLCMRVKYIHMAHETKAEDS